MPTKTFAALSATAMLLSPAAFADTTRAIILSNGTILEGPGTQYSVLAPAPVNSPVVVQGCLATHDWCEIEMDGKTGWMPAADLQVHTQNGQVLLSAPSKEVQVSTVTFDQKKVDRHAAGGALAGAAVGAVAGGPVGAVVGAAIGAAGGAAATAPDKTVTTYVTQNPVPPVALQGRVTVGTVLPDSVTLTPVPDSQYAYIYLNGHPVLVDNATRTVVRVLG